MQQWNSSDCVCVCTCGLYTDIVTYMVKTMLSLSSSCLHSSTRSGNQDNGPAIKNINELHLEKKNKQTLKSTQTYMLLSWEMEMLYLKVHEQIQFNKRSRNISELVTIQPVCLFRVNLTATTNVTLTSNIQKEVGVMSRR